MLSRHIVSHAISNGKSERRTYQQAVVPSTFLLGCGFNSCSRFDVPCGKGGRRPTKEESQAAILKRTRRGIQYVGHTEGHGREMFQAICKLGLEGIVSMKLDAPYKSGPSRTRAIDGFFRIHPAGIKGERNRMVAHPQVTSISNIGVMSKDIATQIVATYPKPRC